jgi:hypothetical protein
MSTIKANTISNNATTPSTLTIGTTSNHDVVIQRNSVTQLTVGNGTANFGTGALTAGSGTFSGTAAGVLSLVRTGSTGAVRTTITNDSGSVYTGLYGTSYRISWSSDLSVTPVAEFSPTGLVVTGVLSADATGVSADANTVSAKSNYWAGVYKSGTAAGQAFGVRIQAGTNASDTAFLVRDATNTNTYLALDGVGNLGLGVAPSAYKLDVKSDSLHARFRAATNTNRGLTVGYDYANDYGQINCDEAGVDQKNLWITGLNLKFGRSTAAANMTLDASGNLQVGGNYASGYRLQATGVDSGSTNYAFRLLNSGPSVLMAVRNDSYTTLNALISFTTASAANVYGDSSTGEIKRSTSALKYKQDIRDLESIDITKFRPVRYKSKCDGDDQTKDHIGFIADEYANSQPELVQFGSDGEVEGFAYERMTAILCKTVQELTARLAALENK